MNSQKAFFEGYEDILSDFIGLPVEFEFNALDKISGIKFGDFENDIIEVNKKHLKFLSETVTEVLNSFYDDHCSLSMRPTYKQLIIEELTYKFLINTYPKNSLEFFDFIKELKKLCNKTYESDDTEMGFIIIKDDKVDIKPFFENNNLRFLPLDKDEGLEYFMSEKESLKIIDSKSVCIVVNSKFRVIGLAQKVKGKQSIINIMLNRHSLVEENNIKILAHNYYVHSNIPDDISIDEEIRKLEELALLEVDKLTTYFNIDKKFQEDVEVINYILSLEHTDEQKEFLNDNVMKFLFILEKQNELLSERNKIVSDKVSSLNYLKSTLEKKLEDYNFKYSGKIDFVYFNSKQIIWNSSYEHTISYVNGQWKMRNYFVLRSILTRFILSQYKNSNTEYMIKKIEYSIPRVLNLYTMAKELSEKRVGSLICILKQSEHRNSTIYKQMLQKEDLQMKKFQNIIKTDSNKPLNIKSIDPYLFELVASVDGAIICNYKLEILSFGEMIKSDKNKPKGEYKGARTFAAHSASRFGLGVKISEDGDIQIFENSIEVARV